MDAPDNPQRASWTDYQTWTDEKRWEIIDGHPYAMTAPLVAHQFVLGELFGYFHSHFKSRPCRPILSPVDVRISEYDVVQPDLIVVCRLAQITKTHIEGAPTLVVEILSPSTQRHDRIRKLQLYAKAGVREYWIIQPYPALVEVLVLEGDGYRISGTYSELDTLVSPSFPEMTLPLLEIFPSEPDEDLIEEVRESVPPYSMA